MFYFYNKLATLKTQISKMYIQDIHAFHFGNKLSQANLKPQI